MRAVLIAIVMMICFGAIFASAGYVDGRASAMREFSGRIVPDVPNDWCRVIKGQLSGPCIDYDQVDVTWRVSTSPQKSPLWIPYAPGGTDTTGIGGR